MSEKRESHLDVVTGLLIIWMIFFEHLRYMCGVQSFVGYVILRKIFFFFMAWFYFKSGMFFNERRSAIDVAKHDWRKFVVPYIIGCVIAVVVQLLYLIFTGQFELRPFVIRNIIDTLNHGGASWNVALWFLLSLYAVKIIFRWATDYAHPIIIALVSLVISYTLFKLGLFRPALLGNIPLGMFFYSVGFFMRERQNDKIVFIGALVLTVVFFCLNADTSFAFRLNRVGENDFYFVVILASICSILVFNNLFIKVAPPILAFIGKKSMIFYVIHYPLGMLFSSIGSDYLHLENIKLFLFACLTTSMMLAVLYVIIDKSNNKFVKMIIGQ